MDREPRGSESVGRISSAGSSFRRDSVRLSGALPSHVDDDIESESVSQAGDIGDRALHSNRYRGIESFNLSADNTIENVVVASVVEDALSQSYGFSSSVSPLPLENVSPLSTDIMVCSEDSKEDNPKVLPQSLECILCLIHLAVFGILGVLTRYLLQKLFGPGVAGVTSDQSIMYLDLPSNMVGSFLMGWWGVVFKGDISHVSEYLAIGLTTGYLGSLTTFSGWNQKMLELTVDGKWLFAVLGFFIGLFLAAYAIIFGVESAKGFKCVLKKMNINSKFSSSRWRVDGFRCQFSVGVVLILIFGLLWGSSGVLVKKEFHNGGSRPQLWLGCMVAPLGVWMRWFLARLNGRGLGKEGYLKWLPFGTLIANISAACAMAALSTVKEVVSSKACDTVITGLQFGLMGCLSTVSTFIAEFNAMRESSHPWRAYAYAITTISVSFAFGTLFYSVPVWAKGYR